MTFLEFVGCSLIAFGPPLSMFSITICKDPIRVIILISAAFFWLLALLFSSVIYFLATPLGDFQLVCGLIFSVGFQEGFRYLFYRLLREAETGLQKVSEVGVQGPVGTTNRVTLSYVAGLGFGIMSGSFSLVNVLADSLGPGTVGLKGDYHYFFMISAFTTLAFILLHTFWSVIFFRGFDTKNYYLVAYVILSHFAVSLLTLFNQGQYYSTSLTGVYLVTVATACFSYVVAGGSLGNIKAAFMGQQ